MIAPRRAEDRIDAPGLVPCVDRRGKRSLLHRDGSNRTLAAQASGAAGEYEPFYFRRMFEAEAADMTQADATRCCGFTGFLRAATLADAHAIPLPAHTARRRSTCTSAAPRRACDRSNGIEISRSPARFRGSPSANRYVGKLDNQKPSPRILAAPTIRAAQVSRDARCHRRRIIASLCVTCASPLRAAAGSIS